MHSLFGPQLHLLTPWLHLVAALPWRPVVPSGVGLVAADGGGPDPSVTASLATSSSLGFGVMAVVIVLVGTLVLVGGIRIAAAVLPRLIQALVALGSAVLVVAVVASVIVLIQTLYQALATH